MTLLSAQATRRPLEIAHRGASALAPENTFAAFDLALELGADGIELDVRMTADDELVVIHDPTLERTARPARGRVASLRAADLARADAGRWFSPGHAGEPVPRLDDVLARYGARTRLHLELKQPRADGRMEDALLALLRRHGLERAGARELVVQSFSRRSLARVAARAPGTALLQLFAPGTPAAELRWGLVGASAYAWAVGPPSASTDAALVACAHARGLAVVPHTANAADELLRLAELGVDGIHTDVPGRLAWVLAGRAASPAAARHTLARAA